MKNDEIKYFLKSNPTNHYYVYNSMNCKRTIEVSEKQINLIRQALGIAELKFSNTHKEIIENLIVVRGVDSTSEQVKISNYYHDKSCEFAELNIAFRNGMLDV